MRTIILRAAALTALAGVSLVLPDATLAQALCDDPDRNAQNWQLVITVAGNAPSGVVRGNVNANRQNVCRGDRVTWRLPSQAFTLRFADDSLFGQALLSSDNNNSVSFVVSSGADRGRAYKYDITLDNGEVLDPHIIVD